jgi:hypothetical protein
VGKENNKQEIQRSLSDQEIRSHFDQELQRLRRLTELYDAGESIWLPTIALCLRKLFHNEGQGKCLLSQLGMDEASYFPDTALPWHVGEIGCYVGLACLLQEHSGLRFAAFLDFRQGRDVAFPEWWRTCVLDDPGQKHPFSREELVLAIADQEGAHCDPSISEAYARIKNDSPFGMQSPGDPQSGDTVVLSPVPGATEASLRQIAHETLKALVPGYAKTAPQNMWALLPSIQIGCEYDSETPEAATTRRLASVKRMQTKIGRNDLCPCGSRKKYKKCCGSRG